MQGITSWSARPFSQSDLSLQGTNLLIESIKSSAEVCWTYLATFAAT
jgi:hypothetical protein